MASKRTFAFVYGTLKRGFPNEPQMSSHAGSCIFVGRATTLLSYPLVMHTSWRVPFLIDRPSEEEAAPAHRVTGEIYEVDAVALQHLDDFEDVAMGYYKRESIEVELHDGEDGGDGGEGGQGEKQKKTVIAGAYFHHQRYQEDDMMDASASSPWTALQGTYRLEEDAAGYVPRAYRKGGPGSVPSELPKEEQDALEKLLVAYGSLAEVVRVLKL